jgi:FAD/FMN-containing dehydrogenase
MLDRLVEAVCAGQSRALVLSGDAGVGKTALLQHVVSRATECRVVQVGRATARFGGENMKDVAGYDTKRLFIGGRGAFGAITTATFKITVNAET